MITLISIQATKKIPLADPTRETPLSKADAATFFVVSTVVLTVLANLSTMCDTDNATFK